VIGSNESAGARSRANLLKFDELETNRHQSGIAKRRNEAKERIQLSLHEVSQKGQDKDLPAAPKPRAPAIR
jgi:hypothetical protein